MPRSRKHGMDKDKLSEVEWAAIGFGVVLLLILWLYSTR